MRERTRRRDTCSTCKGLSRKTRLEPGEVGSIPVRVHSKALGHNTERERGRSNLLMHRRRPEMFRPAERHKPQKLEDLSWGFPFSLEGDQTLPRVRGGDINLIGEVLLTNNTYASRPDFGV